MISESSQHVLFRRPRMLTFITTYKCGAVCDHCLMSCTPNNSDRLTLPQMRQFIDSFAEVCVGSGVVVFTGGECTLLGDDLLEAIAYANSLGLFTRIVTNAWWAKSERDAETFLNELKSWALTKSISAATTFMRNIYPSRMCATFGTQQKQWAFKLSALRSAEITTVQSARHTCASTLMKTFHSCISSTIIPSLPARQPASSRIQASRELGAHEISVSTKMRDRRHVS